MCHLYKHEDLKLEDDYTWNCKVCGRKWEYGSIPIVVLES